ncbi:hypothetical protein GCM10009639_27120 [Kitasatospora putterlickiae]|uniref:DDE Tnp4 domain-containing protein n=1 Tax=Kitasatospora putterlickiae TaxID=221725 RepID=A0ABN1XZB5_9ACTN
MKTGGDCDALFHPQSTAHPHGWRNGVHCVSLGTGLVIPHRRPRGGELTEWQAEHNREHKQVRARVEHVFARMKTWKILRDCRLKGDGVHHAMLGIARLHNLQAA